MTPMQLAVKSYELAKALEAMSPNVEEHVTVLLGAMAIATGSDPKSNDAEKAWEECTAKEAKEMFLKYYVETKTQKERVSNGIPG